MRSAILAVGPIGTNCYLLEDLDQKTCAIIDPGDQAGDIAREIDKAGLTPVMILITHGHRDHNAVDLIKNRAGGCRVITWREGLADGVYKTFDLGFYTVEAVQAGNNRNHDTRECVGWLITLSGGLSVYATGDTSATDQMAELAGRGITYAFFVCDGKYNMDMDEAVACAKTVGARHSIPYHMAPGKLFDRERAELFDVPGRLIVAAGEEIVLE